MKKKIILIGLALALSLALVGGGVAYAFNGYSSAGHKLSGIGMMGYEMDSSQTQTMWWDTYFTVTNPNCDTWLNIDYLALIYENEYVIWEGTPADWWFIFGIDVPDQLSPHQIWQVSLGELMAPYYGEDYWGTIGNVYLARYTVEISWSGVSYSAFSEWGYNRPLIGWAKEKCWYNIWETLPGMTISESEMEVYPVPGFYWWASPPVD
jgi:hypothetical protein